MYLEYIKKLYMKGDDAYNFTFPFLITLFKLTAKTEKSPFANISLWRKKTVNHWKKKSSFTLVMTPPATGRY